MEHLEGRVSILAALQARQRKFEAILVGASAGEDKIHDLLDSAASQKVPVRRVEDAEIQKLAHGTSHGGVVAICTPKPMLAEADLPAFVAALKGPALLLLLEGIDDARNLGFTLRTAEATGVHAVLVKKREWDFESSDVSRSSSGAFERLPVARIDGIAVLEELKKNGLKLYGSIAGASRTIYETQMWKPSIVAVGGEKRGLSGAVRAICNSLMKIPTKAGTLSLSHASAVVLAEAMRQRLSQP